MKRGDFNKWVRRIMIKGEDISLFRIKHVGVNGKASKDDIGRISVSELKEGTSDIDEVISSIVSEVETLTFDDAEGIGGRQIYQILAYADKADNAYARFTMTVISDNEDDADSELSTEPATKAGFLGQLMRHVEGLHRTTTLSFNQVLATTTRALSKVSEQNLKMMDDRNAYMDMMEQMRNDQHMRRMDEMKVDADIRQKEEMIKAGKMLVPAIVNRMTGKQILPELMSPQQVMLQRFMESLKPEQFTTIMGSLDPAQQAVVIEMMEAAQKKSDEEDGVKAGGREPSSGSNNGNGTH